MNKDILKNAGTDIAIMLAALALAFSYQLFIIPNDFAPSGLNGIATMVQYKLGFSIGYMSLLINIPLCIFSWFTTDKRFAFRTLLFCLAYSFGYLYIQTMDLSHIQYNANDVDTIFPCLIAGMVSGAVNGFCVRFSGSTGGTDIVARYISKRNPRLNFFWVTFTINASVAIASFFIYAKESETGLIYDYKPVCLCLLYSFSSSFIGSEILQGLHSAYHFTIITEHPVEIEEEIIKVLHHSATRLEASGAYSHENRSVLHCVVNRSQLTDLQHILEKYDRTFTYVEPVSAVIGRFKRVNHLTGKDEYIK